MKSKSYVVMAMLIIVMAAVNVACVSVSETPSQAGMARDVLI
jgi:hypothetical protein